MAAHSLEESSGHLHEKCPFVVREGRQVRLNVLMTGHHDRHDIDGEPDGGGPPLESNRCC